MDETTDVSYQSLQFQCSEKLVAQTSVILNLKLFLREILINRNVIARCSCASLVLHKSIYCTEEYERKNIRILFIFNKSFKRNDAVDRVSKNVFGRCLMPIK